jgi:hypothetical protein
MPLADTPFVVTLILGCVTIVLAWYIRRHFSQSDSLALSRQQDSGSVLMIQSYIFKRNRLVNALQNGVVVSLYGLLFHPLLSIFVTVIGLVPFYGIIPLGRDLVVGVWTMFPLFVGIGTVSLWLLPRRNARLIPNFLFSKRYSLTDTIFVDKTGFDGLFLLPWSRVRQMERIGDYSLKIAYRRRPYFITRLIGADSITLIFTKPEEVEQILNLFNLSKQSVK